MPLPISPSDKADLAVDHVVAAEAEPVILDARELLRQYGLAAKKSWGQNFLVDERSYSAIVRACALSPDDVAVEVGAGWHADESTASHLGYSGCRRARARYVRSAAQ